MVIKNPHDFDISKSMPKQDEVCTSQALLMAGNLTAVEDSNTNPKLGMILGHSFKVSKLLSLITI